MWIRVPLAGLRRRTVTDTHPLYPTGLGIIHNNYTESMQQISYLIYDWQH